MDVEFFAIDGDCAEAGLRVLRAREWKCTGVFSGCSYTDSWNVVSSNIKEEDLKLLDCIPGIKVTYCNFGKENFTSKKSYNSCQAKTPLQNALDFLDDVKKTLQEKNKAYGDSAANPLRIFSKSDKDEAIKVRIDDKLSRIAKGDGSGNEDAIKDLVGYLALLAGMRK